MMQPRDPVVISEIRKEMRRLLRRFSNPLTLNQEAHDYVEFCISLLDSEEERAYQYDAARMEQPC